jgi:hypothetical protein
MMRSSYLGISALMDSKEIYFSFFKFSSNFHEFWKLK